MTKYFQFKKGGKDDKPTFKYQEETTDKVVGGIKGVYSNPPKDVTTKAGKQVTIPANISIALDNEQYVQISVEQGTQLRAVINSLLSANIGDKVEFRTFTNKKGYKVINVSDPSNQVEIDYTDKDGNPAKFTTGKSYEWVIDVKDIPEVEVIKNKKGELISIDDSEATEFMIDKLKEKFSAPSSSTTEEEISVEDLPFN